MTREQLQLDRSTTLIYYLRAFAETGDLRRCIAEVAKLERDRQLNTQNLQLLLKMYILAYCGRVDRLLASCVRQSAVDMYPADKCINFGSRLRSKVSWHRRGGEIARSHLDSSSNR